MRKRDEFPRVLFDLIDVKLHALEVKIKHYHADGGERADQQSCEIQIAKRGV